jgi:hypothetical protein
MRIVLSLIFLVGSLVPSTAQISNKIKDLAKDAGKVIGRDGLSSDDVAAGLKEALLNGVEKGTAQASQLDGFYKNGEIKIPFPEDAKKVATALKRVGMDRQVKNFVKTLNRSAEIAAKEAKPVFVSAVKDMSVKDAWGILNGEDKQGATNYLKGSTSNELTEKILPIIEEALLTTNATKYYDELITAYNKLPMVEKRDADLSTYATQKTLDGLFHLVGQEELKIRQDPAARTSDLLKKVFK